jgi:hypothetical protein
MHFTNQHESKQSKSAPSSSVRIRVHLWLLLHGKFGD